MKYQFIHARYVRYSVALQCDVLAVSRTGYYQWCRRVSSSRERANAALVTRLKILHQVHKGRYGSPRMTIALQREGYACSRNRVARLMREHGIAARTKRRYCRTTVSDHARASENLIKRQFTVSSPDRVMTCDITYVPTAEGWLYVAPVMDLCTRKIIGLSIRSDMTAELVSDALEQAIARRQLSSGTILHSDRGVQYSSDAYRSIIAEHGFIQSMSRKGDCWDNAPMESFFKTLKTELGLALN
jgi:putative transposase